MKRAIAPATMVGMAGMVLLAGCAAESPVAGDVSYKDGTYTADGSYQTPQTVEKISVTMTLADGVVADVEVAGDPQARESVQYQGQFVAGIGEVVEGKRIDELDVSRVSGSSLTSGGFNQAVEAIKEQAAS